MAERPLAVLGSSSSEVFDYIFGHSPLYHSLWAGGWSARGMRNEQEGGFLHKVVAPLSKDTTILLSFGEIDVNFNLRHKVRKEQFYNFSTHLDEAAAGIETAWRLLSELGFSRVHAIFASPAIPLPREYWQKFGLPVLPPALLGRMYLDLGKLTAARGVPVIDIADRFIMSPDRALLRPELRRKQPNHHAEYITTQEATWRGISHLPDLPSPRTPFLTERYPHVQFSIRDWQKTGIPPQRDMTGNARRKPGSNPKSPPGKPAKRRNLPLLNAR